MAARKPDTTHDLYARIPETLFQQVKALAEAHKRSVTAEVEWALQQYVQAHQAALPETEAGPRGKKTR
jgi:hypothetical protein